MSLGIVYYYRGSEVSPIYVFIEELPAKAQAKTSWTFQLVKDKGLEVGMPYVASIVGVRDLWEIRVSAQGNIYRYLVQDMGNSLMVLHAFVKKTQKTPRREIEKAIERMDL